MTSLTLFGLKQCSTCVKACRWLSEHGMAHVFVDYRAQPIAPTLLRQWAGQLGGWEQLVNRASMTWRNLDESRRLLTGADDWLALIAEYPTLVRRPLAVSANGEVSVGFNEKRYAERFDAQACTEAVGLSPDVLDGAACQLDHDSA